MKGALMASLYDRLKDKKPPRRRVAIPLSDEAVQAFAAAERRNARAILASEAEQQEAKAALEAARETLKAETVIITVQALPRPDWEALQRAHPPTADQKEQAKQDGTFGVPEWNADTFLPAAWEACQVPDDGDQALGYEECSELVKGWSIGEQTKLMQGLLEANQTTVSVEALGE